MNVVFSTAYPKYSCSCAHCGEKLSSPEVSAFEFKSWLLNNDWACVYVDGFEVWYCPDHAPMLN